METAEDVLNQSAPLSTEHIMNTTHRIEDVFAALMEVTNQPVDISFNLATIGAWVFFLESILTSFRELSFHPRWHIALTHMFSKITHCSAKITLKRGTKGENWEFGRLGVGVDSMAKIVDSGPFSRLFLLFCSQQDHPVVSCFSSAEGSIETAVIAESDNIHPNDFHMNGVTLAFTKLSNSTDSFQNETSDFNIGVMNIKFSYRTEKR